MRTGAHEEMDTTGLISLTVNEFRRLMDALLVAARHTITTCCAGQPGVDDTNTELAKATTDDANTNDHNLRLPYRQ